jgi:hypothetical protein
MGLSSMCYWVTVVGSVRGRQVLSKQPSVSRGQHTSSELQACPFCLAVLSVHGSGVELGLVGGVLAWQVPLPSLMSPTLVQFPAAQVL